MHRFAFISRLHRALARQDDALASRLSNADTVAALAGLAADGAVDAAALHAFLDLEEELSVAMRRELELQRRCMQGFAGLAEALWQRRCGGILEAYEEGLRGVVEGIGWRDWRVREVMRGVVRERKRRAEEEEVGFDEEAVGNLWKMVLYPAEDV